MNVIKTAVFTITALVLAPLLIQCMDEPVTQKAKVQEEGPEKIILEQDGKKILEKRHGNQTSVVYYKQGQESVYEEIGRMSLPQYYFFVVNKSPSSAFPSELKQYIARLMVTKSLACNFESSQRIPYMIPDPNALQPPTPIVPGIICSMTFSGNAEKVITGCTDNRVRVWDAQTGILLHTIEGYPARVDSVVCNYDGTLILSLCYDTKHKESSVWVYNAGTKKLTRGLQESTERVELMVPSPDGTMVFTQLYNPMTRTQTVVIWDNAMKTRLITLDFNVQIVVFSPDSKRFFIMNRDGKGQIWDTEKKSLVAQLEGSKPYRDAQVLTAAFSADTTKIFIVYDSSIQVWDTQTAELIRTLPEYYCATDAVVGFTSDQKTMRAIVSSNKTVALLFDTETGNLLGSVEGPGGYNQSAVCSPDDTTLLMGSTTETTYLRTTALCDAYNWILNKVHCYQAWLIVKAADAKRKDEPLILKRDSHEYKLFMNLPEDIQNYLAKWYSIATDIQDCLMEECSLPTADLSLYGKILNCNFTWMIAKAAEAKKGI